MDGCRGAEIVSDPRPDMEVELHNLKDFQRETVDYVHERLYGKDAVERFLVADEVGLGKTLVARGVIAKTIDHLWDTIDRIDVVYICSNNAIAAQNRNKLRIGSHEQVEHADRLTMLPRALASLESRKVNFISFTPGTSFNLKGAGGGRLHERVLLYAMLKQGLNDPALRARRWLRFFRGGAKLDNFARALKEFERAELPGIPREIVASLARDVRATRLKSGELLLDELYECAEGFNRLKSRQRPPEDVSRRRYQLIGQLRHLLAAAAVEKLEPDLVILDEFQRFKSLMDEENEAAELAHALFNRPGTKVLLLSATPFKMYTLPDEVEGDDHYQDFSDTVRFLAGRDRAANVAAASNRLRTSLYAGDLPSAREARDVAQAELRRVMARTERLASTPDRDGMIRVMELPGVEVLPQDFRRYASDNAVAKLLKASDVLEYWRSAPHLFEFMDEYKVKKNLELEAEGPNRELARALEVAGGRLSWSDLVSYAPLDPGNAKMRGLVCDVLDRGAWKLAWIPPSLPYYELSGAYAEPELRSFTKRLVFSSWTVVPKAIASTVSYEAERRLVGSATGSAYGERAYDAARQTALLTFQRSAGRLTGMPVLGMLYPSLALAEAGDQIRIARESRLTYPMAVDELRRHVEREVTARLGSLPPGSDEGRVDDRWYWAAPILLDRLTEPELSLLDFGFGYAGGQDDDGSNSRFVDHVEVADALQPENLGRRPDDLVEVLTLMAVGGPGVVALRTLGRILGADWQVPEIWQEGAATIAWSLRTLFNRPEVMALVRRESTEEEPYWRAVLRHAVGGGLQSVLDEFAHVLLESLGVLERPLQDQIDEICDRMDEALSLRSVNSGLHLFSTTRTHVKIDRSHNLRNHFAVRFGRGTTEDQKSVMREQQVQAAYNSPFWPFVLASTSVGQEGLDFHQYSHAVVHWNLPGNPVDLEQREGRVHRYKGHAVRKNVATKYGGHPDVAASDNPWATVFDLAAAERPEGESMIYPFWVCPGDSAIERYVPAMPLSKETHALRRLMRTVGAYRMVIGQPRQVDLLKHLGHLDIDPAALLIDLSPAGVQHA